MKSLIQTYFGQLSSIKFLSAVFPILLIICIASMSALLISSAQFNRNILTGLLVLLLSMIGIWEILRRVHRQIRQLIHDTDKIATGDVEVTINTSPNNEVGDIARAIESIRRQLHDFSDELSGQKALTESTLNTIADGVITVNNGGMITYMNSAAEQKTGWNYPDVEGHSIKNVFQIRDRLTQEQWAGSTIIDVLVGIVQSRQDVHLIGKDGGFLPVNCRFLPIYTQNEQRLGATLVFSELSETSNLKSELVYQSSHDDLTHLMNRREFERRVQLAITAVRRHDTEHALCYLDLDQFKVINDICGHVAGDELLRQVANLFQSVVRAGDTIARLGGDEFGVLLEHCSTEQAERVTQQLLDAIGDYRFLWEDKPFRIGVSIGLVAINQETSSVVNVLRDADSACYMAKEAGRNRVHIYSDDDTLLVERRGEMQWVDKIDRALEQDDFVLYVQRIEPINAGASDGQHFEVLVRMRDDQGNLVPPGLFLPAAERYSLATNIDRWVVSHTLEWLSHHPDIVSSLALCSINLSGQSLGDLTFLPFIIEQLDKYNVPAPLLCFEITETATIANLSRALLLINTLKERECVFALDDFGSGLSSFGYLKSLPVDFLKIDGQFVKDIVDNTLDFAMVRSINEIGQLMGMQTIAEFVENDAIKSRLRSLGVNYVQGYGVSRPEPMEQLC